jgi:Fe-S cluster assembly iron-binding protein IscA
VIEITERAVELLEKAASAARRFDPNACIRLVREHDGVRFELTDAPETEDLGIERSGFTLYVEPALSGVVDVEEPHDRLVLRRPGGAEGSG